MLLDKYQARYPKHLFLPVVSGHVLELIVVWVLGHVLSFFFFFGFVLAQVPLPNLSTFGLCNTLQLYISTVAQRKIKKGDFIETQHRYHTKEHKRIDKDSKDHRMSFYHGFLNKRGLKQNSWHKKKVENNETLSRLESWQKRSRCTEIFLFSCVVLFQPLPIYRICYGRPIFLCEVAISATMGFPNDVRPFPFRGKFGGS